jgi:hypothetical protein
MRDVSDAHDAEDHSSIRTSTGNTLSSERKIAPSAEQAMLSAEEVTPSAKEGHAFRRTSRSSPGRKTTLSAEEATLAPEEAGFYEHDRPAFARPAGADVGIVSHETPRPDSPKALLQRCIPLKTTARDYGQNKRRGKAAPFDFLVCDAA